MSLVWFLVAVGEQTFWVLYDGALFILLGFAVAGMVHVLLDPDRIVRHLGGRGIGPALLATLLGAPIPLCSCGVLPAAVSLRRKGASREATLAFLTTTPETGLDSFALTLAYFGPLMAMLRVVAAVATGLVAAVTSRRLSPAHPGVAADDETQRDPRHRHDEAKPAAANAAGLTLEERVRAMVERAARYAFVDLLDELGFWLVLAIILTGVLAVVLPANFFARVVPGSFASMVLMVLLGLPLYVCASASTPLAALFVAKGASAGAALVFLLVGPATNAATIATIARLFGRGIVRVYVGAIVGMAIVSGLLVDLLFPALGQHVRVGSPSDTELFMVPKMVAALGLGSLLVWSLERTGLRPGFGELADNTRAALSWARRLRARTILGSRAVQTLACLWLVSVVTDGLLRVAPGERAIVRRLGQVAGAPRAPGMVFATPLVDRVLLVRVDEVRARPVGYRSVPGSLVRDSVADEALYLTADENVIDLHAEVQYRVSDPVRYALGVERPDELVAALVRGRLVEAMTSRPIDFVYTNDRAEVQGWLLERVRQDVETVALGVEVLAVRLLDVHAPTTVHDAFRDVASAHEDRLTTIHLANEYAAGVTAVARGEAARIVSEAEAWAAERLARAHGDAQAFAALAAEHAHAPRLTEDRLYIETAERVLPGARKIVRSTASGPKGYEIWLRRDGAATPVPPSPDASAAEPFNWWSGSPAGKPAEGGR